jgi:hypothetical protein
VNLYAVLLNNQISLTLIEDNSTGNTIFCNSFNEHLFNISVLQTREKEIILEHKTIKDRNFATVDLLFEDGTCFKNITFEIIINEQVTELPYCSFNRNLLESSEIEKLDPPKNKQEFIVESAQEELIPDTKPSINIEEEFKQIVDRKKKLDDATSRALLQEAELIKQRELLHKEKIALEESNIITNRVEEYKLELVKEFFDAIKKQEELIDLKVDGNYEKLEEKVVGALERYKTQFLEQVDEIKEENIEQIQVSLETTIERQRKEIKDLLESEFEDNREAVTATLFEKSVELEKLLLDKVILNLESYKQLIYKEFNSLSKTNINNAIDIKLKKFSQDAEKDFNSIKESFKTDLKIEITNAQDTLNSIVDIFEEKLPAITEILKTDKRLKDLLEDRKELTKSKDNLKKDIVDELKEYCNTTVTTYARRILDLGGGGGSVAVQYANGGIMNGDLNVKGSYLSGGVDLLDIFSSGGLPDRLISGSYQVVLSSNGAVAFPDNLIIDNSTISNLTLNDYGGGSSVLSGSQIEVVGARTTITNGVTSTAGDSILAARGQVTLDSNKAVMEYGVINSLGGGSSLISQNRFAAENDAVMEQVVTNTLGESSSLIVQNQVIVNSNVLIGRRVTNILDGNTLTNFSGWTFDNSYGSLIFPDNTTQTTAYTGMPGNLAYTNQDTIFQQNVTIQGNLTALGTSTFHNTIFTTTSALSVVNLGPGPALYVYQAAGPYDVASFYDGDGIEVLHVGNAQPGGRGFVGINESFPGAELTVNGAISSNGDVSVVNMQTLNAVGIGTYAPLYFNLDVNGPAGNGSIGNSYGNLSFGASSDILINPNNNLLLGPVGNVGIGTTTPSVKLTVNGAISSNATITVEGGNSNDWNSTYTTVNAYSASWEETADIIPTVTNYLSTNNIFLSSAAVADDIHVGGTGYFQHIAAATKSFYISHPLDSSKHLQYGSLESPYHGVRLTGKDKIQKECYIFLPNYMKSLIKEDGVNVQITNINHTQQLYVKSIDIDNNCIIIGRKYNLLNKNEFYEFYWSFTAIRKDIPDLKTEL